MSLDQSDIYRYIRHFPIIGLRGQELLKKSKVLVIGAGGLGSSILFHLASSGIGNISIIDGDYIEVSNLQRQILYTENQVGESKAKTAVKNLSLLNSKCNLKGYSEFINSENADSFILNYDVVIDATDNFSARYLINRVCRRNNLPLISGSIFEFDAQISTFNLHHGPCYECVFPSAPPDNMALNCNNQGVLGVLPGLIGTIQAAEAIKIILNIGNNLSGKLLKIDLFKNTFKMFDVKKNQNCSREKCASQVIKSSVTNDIKKVVRTIEPLDLQKEMDVMPDNMYLIDVRHPYEHDICNIGGTLIPLEKIQKDRFKIPLGKKIVVYCKTGQRGQAAANILSSLYPNVQNLNGGIMNWINKVDQSLMKY